MDSVEHYSTVVRGNLAREPDHKIRESVPGAGHIGARAAGSCDPPVVMLAVVDDRVRRPLEKFLRLRGFAVRLAGSAARAIDTIRSERPAAAIVDLGDAPRPGLDVAVAMPLPQPVIMMSSTPLTTRQLARVRPRTRVVAKPCSLILLIEALHEMLASAESLPDRDTLPYVMPAESVHRAPSMRA